LVAEARAAATEPQDRSLALLPIDVAAASKPTNRTDCKAARRRAEPPVLAA
jgi:hypothetical protein